MRKKTRNLMLRGWRGGLIFFVVVIGFLLIFVAAFSPIQEEDPIFKLPPSEFVPEIEAPPEPPMLTPIEVPEEEVAGGCLGLDACMNLIEDTKTDAAVECFGEDYALCTHDFLCLGRNNEELNSANTWAYYQAARECASKVDDNVRMKVGSYLDNWFTCGYESDATVFCWNNQRTWWGDDFVGPAEIDELIDEL